MGRPRKTGACAVTPVPGGARPGRLLGGGEVPAGSLRAGEEEEQAESGWREEMNKDRGRGAQPETR